MQNTCVHTLLMASDVVLVSGSGPTNSDSDPVVSDSVLCDLKVTDLFYFSYDNCFVINRQVLTNIISNVLLCCCFSPYAESVNTEFYASSMDSDSEANRLTRASLPVHLQLFSLSAISAKFSVAVR